jgi:hypothetical protein
MTMLVISFTLAFVVLLRRRDDSFLQEQIEGVLSSSDKNDPLNQSSITLSDQSQQNLFKDPFFLLSRQSGSLCMEYLIWFLVVT